MPQKKEVLSTKHTLKTYLFTGILVTAPIALTIWLLWKVASYIDSHVLDLLPAKYNPSHYFPYGLPGLGILLLLIFLILVGMLTASYVGRISSRIWSRFIKRMPFISGLYSALRKVFETVLGAGQETAFRYPVLVEFPRRDMWTIAFITGPTYKGIQDIFADEIIAVYVPTTPNPTSGYFVYVPKKDIKPLSIGVDEALKMVISMGIVNPAIVDKNKAKSTTRRQARSNSGQSQRLSVKTPLHPKIPQVPKSVKTPLHQKVPQVPKSVHK